MKKILFLIIFGLMVCTSASFAQTQTQPTPSPTPVKIARVEINRDSSQNSTEETPAPRSKRKNNRTSGVKLNQGNQKAETVPVITMNAEQLEAEKEKARLETEAKLKAEAEQREADLQKQFEEEKRLRDEEIAAEKEKARIESEKADAENKRLEAENAQKEREAKELRERLALEEQQRLQSEEKRQKEMQEKADAENRAEEQRLELERQKEKARIESEKRAEEEQRRIEAEQQAEQIRLESEKQVEQAKLDAEKRAQELAAQAEEEKEKVRLALIYETARRVGYLKPEDAVSFVPADITEAAKIEAVLREKAKADKSLVKVLNFCSTEYVGENYTFDVPSPISLSTLLNDLRIRYGVNFYPDSDLVDTPVQITVNDEPWTDVLRQQLILLDIDATCVGNNAIRLVKREKMLALQQSQEKTAPLVTEYIKLRYLSPQSGGQSNIAGKVTGTSRIDTLEATIQKILTANGDSRGRIAQIPGRAEFFITATSDQLEEIKKVIAKADRPTYRVDVFGLVYTVNESKLKDVGSQLSAVLNADGSIGGFSTLPTQTQNNGGGGSTNGSGTGTNTGTGSTTGSVINGLPQGFTQPSGALGAGSPNSILGARVKLGSAEFAYQLSLLEQLGVARRIEKPFVSAKDGTTGVFENGTQIPVIIQSLNNFSGGSGGQIDVINAGTTLSATPQVIFDADGINPQLVNLTLRLESNTPDLSIQTSGNVPAINSRRIQNEITIAPNQTFIFGGSNDMIDTNNVSRTPVLGDLPIIGNLFKRKTKQTSDNKLYFAVWVQISLDDGTSPVPADNIDKTFVPPPPTNQPLTLPKKKD